MSGLRRCHGARCSGDEMSLPVAKMSGGDRCQGAEMSRGRNVRVAKDVMGRDAQGAKCHFRF